MKIGIKYVTLLGSMFTYLGYAQSDKKPNIIIILADDMGYGDVSALNINSKIQTTHIDRLAREGVVFTDAHSCSSVSSPSRYGLLTGRYSWRSSLKSGVLDGYSKSILLPDRRTIADVLHDKGYITGCFGKWHLGWTWNNINQGIDSVNFSKPISDGPLDHGFDYFYGVPASLDMPPYVYVKNNRVTSLPDHITHGSSSQDFGFWRKGPTGSDFHHKEVLENIVGHAVSFICENQHKPFFLYLPLTAPHTPILPSDRYIGKSNLNSYGDFVLMVDGMVGKIEEALDSLGLDRNTILVFASDNGCSPAAHVKELVAKGHYPSFIYRGYKADLFEGGHRIPCVVRWPTKFPPHAVNQMVSLTDFYATFSQLLLYPLKDNEGEDSYSLLSLLYNHKNKTPKEGLRKSIVSQSINGDFTIRERMWKLLVSPISGGWSYPTPNEKKEILSQLFPIQLYNLTSDPQEKYNVYKSHLSIVCELITLLKQYILEGRSTIGVKQSNDPSGAWEQANKIINMNLDRISNL